MPVGLEITQVVVPKQLHSKILTVAHEYRTSGRLPLLLVPCTSPLYAILGIVRSSSDSDVQSIVAACSVFCLLFRF